MLHDYRMCMIHAKTEENKKYYMAQVALTLHRILPYERPRLQTTQVSSDPDAPVMDAEQLSDVMAKVLTHDELVVLEAVALKLVTGPAAAEAGGGQTIDATGGPVGAQEAGRTRRGGKGSKGRRADKAAAGKARRPD
jgi:hypothetical protein